MDVANNESNADKKRLIDTVTAQGTTSAIKLLFFIWSLSICSIPEVKTNDLACPGS